MSSLSDERRSFQCDPVEYQRGVEALWQSVYMRYPKHVHLETATVCPAACSFCPYPTLERKGTRMSDDLIDKILRDLADIPREIPFQLSPFTVSDPLAERRLIPILRRVNRDLPNATIALTTSGAPLTSKLLDELLALDKITYLWFSVNDHRADRYAALMKLDFERTSRILDMVHEAKSQGRVPFRVVLSRVGDLTDDDLAFCRWSEERYPGFDRWVFNRADWIGQVDERVGRVPDLGCGHWFEICVTSTGTVALCCMDGKAEWAIGDATTEHLLDIYNKPAYKRLRLRTRSRLEVEPCRGCTLY